MKRCALYMRVSTVDQHPETQLYDLRGLAAQRDFTIIHEYTDKISGSKAKRPGLDQLLSDAHRGKFDVVLVWAFDPHCPVYTALPGGARRPEPSGASSSSASGKISTPADLWAGHRCHHRRHRRTRTQPYYRKRARRHAARPPRRPAKSGVGLWTSTGPLSFETATAA